MAYGKCATRKQIDKQRRGNEMSATKEFIHEMMQRIEDQTTEYLPGRVVNAVAWDMGDSGTDLNVSVYGGFCCNVAMNPYTVTYTVATRQFTSTFTGEDAHLAAAQIVSWLITEGE